MSVDLTSSPHELHQIVYVHSGIECNSPIDPHTTRMDIFHSYVTTVGATMLKGTLNC